MFYKIPQNNILAFLGECWGLKIFMALCWPVRFFILSVSIQCHCGDDW